MREEERRHLMAEAQAAVPPRVATNWLLQFQNAAAGANTIGDGIAVGLAMALTGLAVDRAQLIILIGQFDRTRWDVVTFTEFQAVVYLLLKEVGLSPGQVVHRPPLGSSWADHPRSLLC